MTLDKMLAEAKRLSNEDFDILINAMLNEQKDRQDRVRQEAWDKVWEALRDFTERYGEIVIQDNRYGFRQVSLSDDPGFSSSRFGIIEIT